jgi:hypothetical protein
MRGQKNNFHMNHNSALAQRPLVRKPAETGDRKVSLGVNTNRKPIPFTALEPAKPRRRNLHFARCPAVFASGGRGSLSPGYEGNDGGSPSRKERVTAVTGEVTENLSQKGSQGFCSILGSIPASTK